MATLADLFEDTPAAAVPTSQPKLTVVPTATPRFAPAAGANVIPAAIQAERDAEAKRIQEAELAKKRQQLQVVPQPPTAQ